MGKVHSFLYVHAMLINIYLPFKLEKVPYLPFKLEKVAYWNK